MRMMLARDNLFEDWPTDRSQLDTAGGPEQVVYNALSTCQAALCLEHSYPVLWPTIASSVQ